jgi:hypothetical protein
VRSEGSGDVTIEGFSDSKKVTRTFLLGSDLHRNALGKFHHSLWSTGTLERGLYIYIYIYIYTYVCIYIVLCCSYFQYV